MFHDANREPRPGSPGEPTEETSHCVPRSTPILMIIRGRWYRM
jgi:hypothetical protein